MGSSKEPGISITFYTKEECGLCARAKDMLLRLKEDFDFHTQEIDITGDPALYQTYQHTIPVVKVGEVVVFAGIPNEIRLREVLEETAGK